MNKREKAYLDEVVPKLREYKKPSKDQQQILLLADIPNRTDLQERQLVTLINVQLKTKELRDARLRASAIEKEKKNIERKKETRRKILWGSALKTASENDTDIAKLAVKLFDGGYIAEKDKDAIKSDYERFRASLNKTTF